MSYLTDADFYYGAPSQVAAFGQQIDAHPWYTSIRYSIVVSGASTRTEKFTWTDTSGGTPVVKTYYGIYKLELSGSRDKTWSRVMIRNSGPTAPSGYQFTATCQRSDCDPSANVSGFFDYSPYLVYKRPGFLFSLYPSAYTDGISGDGSSSGSQRWVTATYTVTYTGDVPPGTTPATPVVYNQASPISLPYETFYHLVGGDFVVESFQDFVGKALPISGGWTSGGAYKYDVVQLDTSGYYYPKYFLGQTGVNPFDRRGSMTCTMTAADISGAYSSSYAFTDTRKAVVTITLS